MATVSIINIILLQYMMIYISKHHISHYIIYVCLSDCNDYHDMTLVTSGAGKDLV